MFRDPPVAHALPRLRRALLSSRPQRFVMESHALGASRLRPGALLIATGIAVVLYLIGRRLSE